MEKIRRNERMSAMMKILTASPNKIFTLSYFCDALGITLADFFSETNSGINPILASAAKKLTAEQQIKLAEFINDIK